MKISFGREEGAVVVFLVRMKAATFTGQAINVAGGFLMDLDTVA
jgi:hypothetical protein